MGTACQSPAVRNKKRCRMHGGAKGSGAQPGNKNAMTHGLRTAKYRAHAKRIRGLIAEAKRLVV
ncbi:HGGxSTG domain-containing protein [Sphingopyxis granuli]|uniref:HGGxSTG domain-containing protein n=1 Tax=Sphingopyxis granuli TaxID=267128 RepID=UPI003B84A15A